MVCEQGEFLSEFIRSKIPGSPICCQELLFYGWVIFLRLLRVRESYATWSVCSYSIFCDTIPIPKAFLTTLWAVLWVIQCAFLHSGHELRDVWWMFIADLLSFGVVTDYEHTKMFTLHIQPITQIRKRRLCCILCGSLSTISWIRRWSWSSVVFFSTLMPLTRFSCASDI